MDYLPVTELEWTRIRREQGEELSGCEFIGIPFAGQNLKGLAFIDCKFTGCNLSNLSLMNAVLRDVHFKDCNLMGINWTEIRKGGTFHFSSCKLDYGCFQRMDLRGQKFEDCSVREADFSEANLAKANFTGCQLSGTIFNNVNLEKSDFRQAHNYFIDPRLAKLKEAKFSFPEAIVLLEALGINVEV